MTKYEIRERVVAVLERAADRRCSCHPLGGTLCLSCDAKVVLEEITTTGLRLRRWRQDATPVISAVHVADVVVDIRQPRPSCPGYIAERYQNCARCGAELIRGRWARYFDPGDLVAAMTSRTGAGRPILSHATGSATEKPCRAKEQHPRDTKNQ